MVMHPSFSIFIDSLHNKYEKLVSCSIDCAGQLPKKMPEKGVYLFSEKDTPLYVGRSNRLRRRYNQHCGKSSPHNAAAFAFKLAREITDQRTASYVAGKGDRKTLMQDEAFNKAFKEAKERIRKMDYRFVEEEDQVKQALLEIYCTVVLKTPYNDFDTH
jgi:predicted GIY-YIG superfamily endonuclease